MALSLRDVTLALGNLAGNRGTPYAAGLSAEVFSQTTVLQSRIRSALNRAGEKLGPILGSSIPEALAAGAARTGGPATSALERKLAGVSLPQVALIAAAVGVGFWLWRKK